MYGCLECHQNRFMSTFNCHWQINILVSLNWLQCFQMACAHYQCEINIGWTTWSFLHRSVKSHLVPSILELAKLIWDSSQENMSTTIMANVTTKPLSEHCNLRVIKQRYTRTSIRAYRYTCVMWNPHQQNLTKLLKPPNTTLPWDNVIRTSAPPPVPQDLSQRWQFNPWRIEESSAWSPVTFMYWIMSSLAEWTLTVYGKCSLPGLAKQTPHLPVYSQHTCSLSSPHLFLPADIPTAFKLL